MKNSISKSEYWWSDITKDYSLRELQYSDMSQIQKLIETNQYFWKSLKLSTEDAERYSDYYAMKLRDTLRWKCLGIFRDEVLIMESSGFFPPKANFWYCTSLRHSQDDKSLFSGNIQRFLFAECIINLMNHGESLEKFSFYSMRSVKHQKIINRMWDRTREESPLKRYEYYTDAFIPANNPNDKLTYEVFFPENKVYDIDLVVTLHCLKQCYRLDILGEKCNIK